MATLRGKSVGGSSASIDRPRFLPGKDGVFLLGWMARLAPLLTAAGLASAVGPDSLHAQIIVEDDLGRSVVFAESPCRIVSLIPAATEIVFALGAEVCLVGRSIYDDHPAGVESIPEVGQAIGADVERVRRFREAVRALEGFQVEEMDHHWGYCRRCGDRLLQVQAVWGFG